ncbi:flagellar biosynthesis protein FlgL [Erythrobacter sp. LQ02-29]|uniref:flagellin N-terminal helical domain-containing protein n=1 Tax=Erythrobacter sp. LQ02-29 TaxID=2920384 RepID=UPI001F4D5097|nr:flagellar biosynthesis protein FlgL [Erythrobacter sp. LQ02-29]MCP9221220.1 flagellar biosynthesis protein FlgL [Erythrobacter sp. LQ02-29]
MPGPVNSTLAFYDRSTMQMGSIRREAERLQEQLSTGSKLSRSSDNPVAASRLRQLGRMDKLAAIDSANAARANDSLSLAGSSLQLVADDIVRARELALWAANASSSPQERYSIGQELAQMRLGILATANARDSSGNALFGGAATGDAYALDGNGDATYVGTAAAGELSLGDGQSVSRGVTGPSFLDFQAGGQNTDLLAYLRQLSDTLLDPTVDDAMAKEVARGAAKDLDGSLDSVVRTQTVIGARLAWVETVQGRQETKAQVRTAESGEIGGIDFAETIAELQQMMTVLEASQAGFSRLASLSLFNSI